MRRVAARVRGLIAGYDALCCANCTILVTAGHYVITAREERRVPTFNFLASKTDGIGESRIYRKDAQLPPSIIVQSSS